MHSTLEPSGLIDAGGWCSCCSQRGYTQPPVLQGLQDLSCTCYDRVTALVTQLMTGLVHGVAAMPRPA